MQILANSLRKLALTAGILTIGIANNTLQAQPVITTAHMPAQSDTLRMSNATILSQVDLSITGANQTWDFSDLEDASQSMLSYRASSSTPYAFYFFNTYGVRIADTLGAGQFAFTDVYQFFKNRPARFTVEGIGFKTSGIPLAGTYADPDELYTFPLTFGNRDSTTFEFNVAIPFIGSYGSKGYRITEVDGYGQITTPYGTFNAIRVVSTIRGVDTINVNNFGFTIPNNRIEYRWLSTAERAPILQVTGNEVAGTFVPTQTQYRDIWRRFALSTESVSGYNPDIRLSVNINGMATVNGNFGLENGIITATDMLGRVIASAPLVAGTNSVNLQLPDVAGVYVLQVRTDAGASLWSDKVVRH